jgi:hypothetical protein
MGQHLASFVDLLHALAIVAWVAGLPILFLRKWPRARKLYAVYALAFIALSKVSQWLLGACFLTRLSTLLWHAGTPHAPNEPETWFTVRFAEAVFHLRPSEDAVIVAWNVALAISCAGLLVHLHHARAQRRATKMDERPPREMITPAER